MSNTNEKTKAVVAIDVGSSSIRSTAYSIQEDESIQLIPNTNKSHTMTVVEPISGKININVIIKYVDECIDQTLQELTQNNDIEIIGFGISTFVGNLIGVDENGNVVEDAMISYACCDDKVVNDGFQLRKSMDDETFDKLYKKTGTYFLHSSYALLQLRNYYKKSSESKVYKWQSVASILLSHWISNENLILPISYSEASWTGLFNYKTCTWESDLFDDALLPKYVRNTLPDVQDMSYSIKLHHDDDSNHWKYKYKKYIVNAPFYLGIGDGVCANIGSKATNLSRIAITIGTSAAVRICYPLPINDKSDFKAPHGLFTYRINKSYVLIGGALTDGGSIIQWLQSLLNVNGDDFVVLMNQVSEYYTEKGMIADKNLAFLPFLSGERSTNYNNKAVGTIIGINRTTSSKDLLYISLQGVVLRIYAIITLLQSILLQNDDISIIASGKALEKNELWRKMISDCTGVKIVMDHDACMEGTSRGVVRIIEQLYYGNDDGFDEEGLNVISNHVPDDDLKGYWMDAFYRQEKVMNCMKNAFDD